MPINLGLNLTVNLGIIELKGGFDDAEYRADLRPEELQRSAALL